MQPLVRSMCSLLQANQEDYLVAALRHLLSMVSFSPSLALLVVIATRLWFSLVRGNSEWNAVQQYGSVCR